MRAFGRFTLRRLLGKSDLSMSWLVHDPRSDQDWTLIMPREQPGDAAALQAWLEQARRASRLGHPQLAAAVEVDSQEHWPYLASDRALGVTLPEWLAQRGPPSAPDAAAWIIQILRGLAYAHDAGMAHRDLQAHHVAIDELGRARLLGLGVVGPGYPPGSAAATVAPAQTGMPDPSQHQRDAAQLDVLAAGLLLYALLAGEPAFGEPDPGRAIARMPPHGHEHLRLPRLTPKPIPEPLRAIVDRSVGAQERLRYRNARTLLQALEGWHESHERGGAGGPAALLLDRLPTLGHLPAAPGIGARVTRLTRMEKGRTLEMAELILQDLGLSFELLRNVNSAAVRATLLAGGSPVLTIRGAILMLGLEGVRNAATALRAWPGPLDAEGARALNGLMARVRAAAQVAQAIRPAGFDAEVVFLVTALQNLGRLVVQYHFAQEAAQMRQLMRPLPGDNETQSEHPGLSETAAAHAVLGCDIESLGSVVVRHWGLTEDVLHLVRRLAPDAPVRQVERDDDLIRATASCANELVDVLDAPASRQPAGVERVAQRYARVLGVTRRDLEDALRHVDRGRMQPQHEVDDLQPGHDGDAGTLHGAPSVLDRPGVM